MRRTLAASAVLLAWFAGTSVAGQPNRCVECHFANLSHVPAPDALMRWDQSPHAKHGVSCERCHGGDPTTYQPVDAHKGVLTRWNALSTVNRQNLVLTCAPCHAGVAAAFNMSGHASSGAGDRLPSCTTCHGAMAAETPSPGRLESACGTCHTGASAHADYPSRARRQVEALRAIEQTLSRLEISIAAVDSRAKRNRLAAELLLARASLRSALDAVHTFDFGVMEERRALAQRRTSELVASLLSLD